MKPCKLNLKQTKQTVNKKKVGRIKKSNVREVETKRSTVVISGSWNYI